MCGITDWRVLTFHHRDPKQKKYEIGNASRKGYSLETIQEEIDKCDVLCANCHAIFHHEERGEYGD